jgi:Cft2 family RNA processing exonuclease
METTFGRPRYVFPPEAEVFAAIERFCRDALADRAVPVLYGYSLGKSQELLCGLAGACLPIMVHPQIERMNRVHERLGVVFPPWRRFDVDEAAGHVVIAPWQSARSPWLRGLPKRRTAAVTGWALDRGAVHRHQCDAVFPLSDHAGFDDLLLFVRAVRPSRVYTVHGFAADFAGELRARGIEAWALGEENQLEFRLDPQPP